MWGRQAGKSTWAANELAFKAWNNPETNYWFLSPTYDQAKIQYRRLVGALWNCNNIFLKKNQTELRLKFINNSQITFKSGEVLENLRGETLHGVIIDEVREQHKDLWSMVIRPMLGTTDGWASFISTPNGYDGFYDLVEQAKASNDWETIYAPSICNPLFSKQEYERLQKEMSESQFSQEILAQFRDLTAGKAYITFGDHNIKDSSPFIREGLIHPSLPIVLGLDFNVSPIAWVLGQHRIGDFYFFDEIYLERSHTPEASKELIYRLSSLRDRGLLKSYPQILIAGDATGSATKTSSAGQSDYDILCSMLTQAGFSWSNITPSSNPHVKDRVNTVNAKCRAADGSIHLWLHPQCKHTIKDFQRVTWKEGASAILDQIKDKTLTHSSDAVGYPVCALSPINSSIEVGKMHILYR